MFHPLSYLTDGGLYRWNHTTAFGPAFASVLKRQINLPNVRDLTFSRVIYWNHTSSKDGLTMVTIIPLMGHFHPTAKQMSYLHH